MQLAEKSKQMMYELFQDITKFLGLWIILKKEINLMR